MVFNVRCEKCPHENKSYDLFNFAEHYAAVHLGGFHMFTCPSCRMRFASNFSANYHVANCWDQTASISSYSRSFKVTDLEDVDELKAAVENAVSQAAERLVEEKLEMHRKSEDMDVERANGTNNYDSPCPLYRQTTQRDRDDERRSHDRRRSRSNEKRRGRSPIGRDRSYERRSYHEKKDRRRADPQRISRVKSIPLPPPRPLTPTYGYNSTVEYPPQMYGQRNPPYPYGYPPLVYPRPTQNISPTLFGGGDYRTISGEITGPMQVANMKLFSEKTDVTDSVLELDSPKGFIQMHFNSKFLSDASPYFKKLFSSSEFLNSADRRLTICRPFVTFVDVMNALHYKTLPWKMRCRQYFSLGNLHRIYRALKEARELELPAVTSFLGESLFRSRCFAGEEITDCTTCLERVVLALHFGLEIPEDLKFPEECCRKWLSDCATHSCAPELDMVSDVQRYLTNRFMSRFPGLYK